MSSLWESFNFFISSSCVPLIITKVNKVSFFFFFLHLLFCFLYFIDLFIVYITLFIFYLQFSDLLVEGILYLSEPEGA